jgi:hypothetical protein
VWTLIITAHAGLGDVRLAGRVLEDAVRDGACNFWMILYICDRF